MSQQLKKARSSLRQLQQEKSRRESAGQDTSRLENIIKRQEKVVSTEQKQAQRSTTQSKSRTSGGGSSAPSKEYYIKPDKYTGAHAVAGTKPSGSGWKKVSKSRYEKHIKSAKKYHGKSADVSERATKARVSSTIKDIQQMEETLQRKDIPALQKKEMKKELRVKRGQLETYKKSLPTETKQTDKGQVTVFNFPGERLRAVGVNKSGGVVVENTLTGAKQTLPKGSVSKDVVKYLKEKEKREQSVRSGILQKTEPEEGYDKSKYIVNPEYFRSLQEAQKVAHDIIETAGGFLEYQPGESIITTAPKALARSITGIGSMLFMGGATLGHYAKMKIEKPEETKKLEEKFTERITKPSQWKKTVVDPIAESAQQRPIETALEIAGPILIGAGLKYAPKAGSFLKGKVTSWRGGGKIIESTKNLKVNSLEASDLRVTEKVSNKAGKVTKISREGKGFVRLEDGSVLRGSIQETSRLDPRTGMWKSQSKFRIPKQQSGKVRITKDQVIKTKEVELMSVEEPSPLKMSGDRSISFKRKSGVTADISKTTKAPKQTKQKFYWEEKPLELVEAEKGATRFNEMIKKDYNRLIGEEKTYVAGRAARKGSKTGTKGYEYRIRQMDQMMDKVSKDVSNNVAKTGNDINTKLFKKQKPSTARGFRSLGEKKVPVSKVSKKGQVDPLTKMYEQNVHPNVKRALRLGAKGARTSQIRKQKASSYTRKQSKMRRRVAPVPSISTAIEQNLAAVGKQVEKNILKSQPEIGVPDLSKTTPFTDTKVLHGPIDIEKVDQDVQTMLDLSQSTVQQELENEITGEPSPTPKEPTIKDPTPNIFKMSPLGRIYKGSKPYEYRLKWMKRKFAKLLETI